MTLSPCPHAGLCSGCAGYIELTSSFYEAKERVLTEAAQEVGLILPCIAMVAAGDDAYRDRVDLTFQNGKLGFFSLEKKNVFDLVLCRQFSPALQEWVTEFQSWIKKLDVQKGSVRLRVSAQGVRGVWLDFSNEDIARLLKQTEWLCELKSKAQVEIGQRFKALVQKADGTFGLSKEREFHPWFMTFRAGGLQPYLLYSAIGSFTQPGIKANRVLVGQVLELLKKTPEYPVMELFSGIGNFTLALASAGRKVDCFEVDELSLASFRQTLFTLPELNERIHIHEMNLYQKVGLPEFHAESILFVDPPRSGLKEVLTHLLATASVRRPDYILYVSCFAPSFAQDLAKLVKAGYEIEDLRGFDQFPQSCHCEWGALLKKNIIG